VSASPYEPIRERLDTGRVVILDGGIGTEVLRRDLTWADHQVLDRPDAVRGLHADYIRAGADVISTNSFQLSRRSFVSHFRDERHMQHIGSPGLEERARRMLAASVTLAQEARREAGVDRPVAVAGAVTTLEWCFRPDLAPSEDEMRDEYAEIMRTLAKAGADLILLETVNSVTEARVGLQAARAAGLPCWVGFVCDQSGRLFTGETLADAQAALAPDEPDVVLINCVPPNDATAGLRELTAARQEPCGVYPHIGRFDPPEWHFTDEYHPLALLEEARLWRDMGVQVIGGCCGTTPDHIAVLATGLRES